MTLLADHEEFVTEHWPHGTLTGDDPSCRARLSAFKVPEVVEFRDAFPRTSVGKIQKHLF